MKDAGEEILREWAGGDFGSPRNFVTRFYLAMWEAMYASEKNHAAQSDSDEVQRQCS